MWSISNNNLPISPTLFNNSCITTVLKENTASLTNSGLVARIFDNTSSINAIAIPGLISDTYELNLDSTPVVIRTSNKVFTPAKDISTPVSGEFVYTDGKAVVYSNTPITNVSYQLRKKTKSLSIPLISGLAGLPVVGDINITDSWQDHPSAAMTLLTTINNIGKFRARFPLGSLFSIDRFEFVINSYNEELNTEDNIATISIGLRGKWDIYANQQIPLIETSATSGLDPECLITSSGLTTVGVRNSDNSKGFVTYLPLTKLAERVGANVSGINFNIKVDRSNFNATTTISNELNSYLDINSSFIDYSNPNSIVVKNLDNVSTFDIEDGDLKDGTTFTTSINRNPPKPTTPVYRNLTKQINYNALVPTTITTPIYTTIVEDTSIIQKPLIYNFVTPDNFLSTGKTIVDEPTRLNNDRYEFRKPVIKRYRIGDVNRDSPETDPICPENITALTNLDMNYDRSGVTKTVIDKVEEDGFPIMEITSRYGFAYTAWDITTQETVGLDAQVFTIYEPSPATYWKLIEQTVKTYIYDEQTGYLLGYDLTGKKLLRVKVEGEDLFTQQYNIALQESETPSATDTAIYNNYLFSYVPVYGAKRYLLAQHRSYYKQFESEEKFIKKCNRDGSSSYVLNPNYVEPMFAIGESEEYSCYIQRDNPANIEVADSQDDIKVYQPPLSSGKECYNRTTLKILPSKNTVNASSILIDPTLGEDKYLTYSSNFEAQDPGFGTVTETTSDSESTGIPPIHTRKPPKYQIQEPAKEILKEVKPYRYVFWTEPYNGGYPRTGNYNFDKAKNITEVQNAVLNQLRIDDIRNTLTSSCTVLYNTNIKSGDKVNINVNGINCKRRVINATHNIQIEGLDVNQIPYMKSNGTSLTMGIERDLSGSINRKQEKIPKPTDNIFNVVNVSYELGSLLGSDLLNRRGK